MQLRVLFFAAARTAVGVGEATFTVGGGGDDNAAADACTVAALVAAVVAAHPALAPLLASLVLAVNMDYVAVDSTRALAPSDQIAFIPPISGG
jgi:molybdopterin synthase catalytic subunit